MLSDQIVEKTLIACKNTVMLLINDLKSSRHQSFPVTQ